MQISVIIPVYNASQYLAKAVHSALQFPEVAEIILAEDGSTDNSLLVCEKLAADFPTVKLVRHEDLGNHGAGAARNLGLKHAVYNYVAFLDADDYYLPNRFEAEKKYFQRQEIHGVFGALGIEYLSEKGKTAFQEKFKANTLTTVNFPAEGKEVFRGLIDLTPAFFGSFFHLNTLTVQRKILHEKNIGFNENLRVHQDSDFILKLAYHSFLKTGIIDQPIAIRGVHDENRITKIKTYSSEFYRKKLLFHQSLYEWSEKNVAEKDFRKKIKLDYLSFKTANQKGIKKYISYVFFVLQNPQLLRTRYRFHALQRPEN